MLAVWSRDIIVMIKMDRLPVFIVYCLLRMEIRPNARTDYILSLLHSVLIIKITSRNTNKRDERWKLAYQSDMTVTDCRLYIFIAKVVAVLRFSELQERNEGKGGGVD